MIGRKNSVALKVIGKNEEIFISGCPCHLAHIAASHANDSFSTHLGLNVEDVCVDLFYWFDKNSKRKGKLLEYFKLCDQEYQSVLKHLSVRWLSLERCLDRVVKKLPSLRAYFLSEEDFADARFQRLNTWFSNKLLEPALMFQNATIPIFTNFNLLLQRDEPCIHLLKPSIEDFGRCIANRIIKPHATQNISTVNESDFGDESIFKDKKDLFLGGTTKATLNRLLCYGDISDTDYDKFYDAVFYYYKDSLAYVIKKFPIQNELVCNAVWVDVEKRLDATWHNVQYFLDRFSSVKSLEFVNVDTLYEEFVDYQTLSESELDEGFEKAKVTDGIVNVKDVFHYRMDVVWWYLANLNTSGTSVKNFITLQRLQKLF